MEWIKGKNSTCERPRQFHRLLLGPTFGSETTFMTSPTHSSSFLRTGEMHDAQCSLTQRHRSEEDCTNVQPFGKGSWQTVSEPQTLKHKSIYLLGPGHAGVPLSSPYKHKTLCIATFICVELVSLRTRLEFSHLLFPILVTQEILNQGVCMGSDRRTTGTGIRRSFFQGTRGASCPASTPTLDLTPSLTLV